VEASTRYWQWQLSAAIYMKISIGNSVASSAMGQEAE
jgi:hypothetical protein